MLTSAPAHRKPFPSQYRGNRGKQEEGAREIIVETDKWARVCLRFTFCRNHIKDNEHFRKGEVDIESLCDDLQKKARCSETGRPIDKGTVDHMLEKFAASNTSRGRN